MGFADTEDGTGPSPQPCLMVLDDTHFYLTDQFYFVLPAYADVDFDPSADPATHGTNASGRPFIRVVPRTTDLASVPAILWGLMASYGRQTLPALLHDQLSDQARAKRDDPATPPGQAYEDRCHADNLFRHALRDVGVEWMRRWTFWAGVCFGRYATFDKPLAIVLAVVAGLFSVSFHAGLVGLGWSLLGAVGWLPAPAWPVPLVSLGAVAAPLLVALPFRRRRLWAVLWVGTYVGLPVAALFALGWLVLVWTRLVPWAVLWVLDRIPGVDLHPGPRPPLTPTGLRPL